MNLPGGLEITWLDSPLATAYQEILLHIRGPNGFKLPARSEEFLTKLSPKVVVLLLVAFFFIVKHLYTSWKLRVCELGLLLSLTLPHIIESVLSMSPYN